MRSRTVSDPSCLELIEVCQQAARAGGEVLTHYRGRAKARQKAPRDLVSEADFESQRVIREFLLGRFPEHAFVGEEEEAGQRRPQGPSEHRWLVDPLDGTVNYVHGLGGFAVSVAVEHRGEVMAGAVFDPLGGEMYCAAREVPSRLNDQPISTSGCRVLDQAMIAASFSANVTRQSLEISRFIEMLVACQALRRLGSAALNLCYVAAGRLDGYWATSVKSWDIAAGMLILRQAGGTITALDGGPVQLDCPEIVAAAGEPLNRQMRQVLLIAQGSR